MTTELEITIGELGTITEYAQNVFKALGRLKGVASQQSIDPNQLKQAARDLVTAWNDLGNPVSYEGKHSTKMIHHLGELIKKLREQGFNDQAKQLEQQLENFRALEHNVWKELSRDTGELRKELHDIKKEESLIEQLIEREHEPTKEENKLLAMIKDVEGELSQAIEWTNGAITILRTIQQKLEQMKAA